MTDAAEAERSIEWVPLDQLTPDPANPKGHDEEVIAGSISKFGMVDLITRDDRTGYIISGHGRLKSLQTLHATGAAPPSSVRLADDGTWLAPVVTGWSSTDDLDARGALITLNRATELGGWVDDSLLLLLDELRAADRLEHVGFGDDDIKALRERITAAGEEDPAGGADYTKKVDPIQYEPTMAAPPPVDELVNRTRANDLIRQISEADLPDPVRDFLLAGAQRHLVFDYAKIAEFYAHAPAETQALMEASALVIIDVDDAISHGYVRLSDQLRELLDTDLEYRAGLDRRSDSLRDA